MVQEVHHNDLTAALAAPVAVLDFNATWCGPCKMLSPVVEEIAGESDAYRVCKINVDDAPEIAARYRVMSIPTLIVFRAAKRLPVPWVCRASRRS